MFDEKLPGPPTADDLPLDTKHTGDGQLPEHADLLPLAAVVRVLHQLGDDLLFLLALLYQFTS